MELRVAGNSSLKIPVLSFGTATFGGGNEFFRKWGATDAAEAQRLVDICLEAGINFFDTADVYSGGLAEEILGHVLRGRRQQALIGTKVGYRSAPGPNGIGAGRQHIVSAFEASLRRLGCDYVDLLQLHGFDENTPIEETLRAFDMLVAAGKVRYIGLSNCSGWHLAKTAAAAQALGLARPVTHQAYYSLYCRDFEHELMPASFDCGIGTMVWSPLSGGKLSGKIRRGRPIPADSRTAQTGGVKDENRLFDIVDVLAAIADERGKTVSQVAINWVITRPTIASIVIGARNEAQLRDNIGAAGWRLSGEEVQRLDSASQTAAPYPYSHQRNFSDLIKPLT